MLTCKVRREHRLMEAKRRRSISEASWRKLVSTLIKTFSTTDYDRKDVKIAAKQVKQSFSKMKMKSGLSRVSLFELLKNVPLLSQIKEFMQPTKKSDLLNRSRLQIIWFSLVWHTLLIRPKKFRTSGNKLTHRKKKKSKETFTEDGDLCGWKSG